MKSKKLKIFVIGDTHDSPHIPDKSRFGWFAKHISKTKPDAIVHIGDFVTLDSCTHYIKDDTYTARIEKPYFTQEIRSLEGALEEFDYWHKYKKIPKYITFGNHERRLWRYEDKNPSFYGWSKRIIRFFANTNGK